MATTCTTHRVNYAETDQMGVVYHANYLVWLDVARTEHLRQRGMSYADLEARGYRLAVGEVSVRYLRAARFDDVVTVECRVADLASRRIIFRYVVRREADGERLAEAETAMLALDADFHLTRLPADVLALLRADDTR